MVVAAKATEALEVLKREKFDCLLSDIEMPDMDGYAFIRQVRELEQQNEERKIPAAALTAYARAEDRKKALLEGYQIHLAKPVEPSELAVVVAALVGRTGHATSS